ncbi:MAG TPA: helix-turn-helix transcriptional regulator [Pseudonocardiaceae bacterium]
MTDSSEGTELLAEAVLERRKHKGLRQGDVELKGGVSIAVLRNIESGRRDNPQRKTLSGLDRALEWPTGAAKAVLTASVPPFPGSRASDLRGYVKELISGDFRPVDRLSPEHTEAARNLPTIVLLVELARRLEVDLTTVTGGKTENGTKTEEQSSENGDQPSE